LVFVLESDGVAELMAGDGLPVRWKRLIETLKVKRLFAGPGDGLIDTVITFTAAGI
jgi:hypothetical protein